ncbi:MAG: HAD-IA family hydrolase [Anaerolineae bacterium]|nr:HAD-IA family hydrolase [Phycisphaerae bacterium]
MSNPRDDVRLAVFDLGQVLVRVCDGWQDACYRIGIARDRADLNDQETARMTEIIHRWDSGLIDLAQFAEEVAPLRGISPADVLRIHQAYLLGPFEGAVELVDELNAAGLQTACLSNTNAGHWKLMSTRGDPNFFPLNRLTFQFASHLIGCCKPEEKIYRHVEEGTGASGSQIVFFDDRVENVDAAKRIGWHAHVIELDGDPVAQVRRHLRR